MSDHAIEYATKRMCDRCGKVVTVDGFTPERCTDCGGSFVRPTAEDLACDRCGRDDASRVFGPTDHNRLCDRCVTAVNVEAALPEYLDGAPWTVDNGIHILTLTGRCSCGNHDYRVVPEWKVPAEQGGGYMTSQCPQCLGTMEYSEQWERLDRVVNEYADLNADTDRGGEE